MQPDLTSFQRQFVEAIDRPAAGALAVYRNTVIHGAVEALRSNYPVVEQIVGEEMFEGVAAEFVSARPPLTPVLALYGAEFSDWIERQPWFADLPYLADVARVERLHVECLMSADAKPLSDPDVKALCRLPNTRLHLHPAVRFGWLQTPAMTIWLAHSREISSALEPEWKAEGALFARPDPLVVHAPRIGRAAHRLLSGIRLGETIHASMEAAGRLYPQEDCAAVLASLVNLGVFAAPASGRN